ncbi:hypothetical protein LG943_24670 [Streptomonospora sp. S1-112]|uniref:Uncharacterized protein n=1 Tax=Streptomonospora mangrovi TaxID=2883123 RepID=A0A9X3NQV1_9ACTN|nr:hypothetical protein [Streptomonospora mangrovi]MDA0567490.1 hypothetical protein [Streptomonospora mangrovi]
MVKEFMRMALRSYGTAAVSAVARSLAFSLALNRAAGMTAARAVGVVAGKAAGPMAEKVEAGLALNATRWEAAATGPRNPPDRWALSAGQNAAQVRTADTALDRTVGRMAATQERLESNDRVPEAIVAAHGQQLALARENQARRVSGQDAPRGLRPGRGDAARLLDLPRGALARAVRSASSARL